jgi:hypothetical protein
MKIKTIIYVFILSIFICSCSLYRPCLCENDKYSVGISGLDYNAYYFYYRTESRNSSPYYLIFRFFENGKLYYARTDSIPVKKDIVYFDSTEYRDCYITKDSILIAELTTGTFESWEVMYFIIEKGNLVEIYRGHRYFRRCHFYTYEEIRKKNAKKITYKKVNM